MSVHPSIMMDRGSQIGLVLGGLYEDGKLSLLGVAFEPLCSQIGVVLGGLCEDGQLSLIGVAFDPLCVSPHYGIDEAMDKKSL